MFVDLRRRSLRRYQVDPRTGCHVWQGATTERGYGIVHWDGRRQRVHRLTYQQKHGPIPDGLEIDHLCRNRTCINPAHLEAVPAALNVRRGLASKLDERQVERIRALCADGASYAVLSRQFAVSKTTIARIVKRKGWLAVEAPARPRRPYPLREEGGR